MKFKFEKKPDPDLEQDDDVEVESTGPEVGSAKKSKFTIIAASSLLITVVIYFFFIKTPEENPKEKLQEVAPPPVASVAASDDGKSPFEIELPKETEKKSDEKSDKVEALTKPATPEIPALPELAADSVGKGQVQSIQDLIPPAQQPQAQQNQQQIQQVQQNQQMPQIQQIGQQAGAAPPTVQQQRAPSDPRYAPIIVLSGPSQGSPTLGVGYDKNIVMLNDDPVNSMQKTKSTITPTYISDRTHTIAQGKLLTAVLETAINTEVPGFVRAIISRDVYAESGNNILIPRGSRLYGSYSSQVVRGQGRVQIGWTRLIRPDGVDMAISFNASDQFGRAGIPGDVDNKYSSIVASSLLTSVLAVGSVAAAQKLLTNNATTTTTTNPTQGTTTSTGSATNQALYDVTKTIINTVGQVIGNSINSAPVIRVPQGTRITVIANSDITIPEMRR